MSVVWYGLIFEALGVTEAMARREQSGRQAGGRAKYYTPEITQVKLHCKMPLKVHWTFPVNIHLESDNHLENTTEKGTSVGKHH